MALRLRSFHPPPVIGFLLLLALAVNQTQTSPATAPGFLQPVIASPPTRGKHDTENQVASDRTTKSPPRAGFFMPADQARQPPVAATHSNHAPPIPAAARPPHRAPSCHPSASGRRCGQIGP